MKKEDIHSAFDRIALPDGRKKQILSHIEEEEMRRMQEHKAGIWRALASAAAVCFVIGVAVMGVDAATDGKISNAIKGLFGLNTDTPEVVHQAEQYIFIDMIYAPDVVYLDEETLIFSTGRALFICDRQDRNGLQTVDLQKTDCIYWNVSAGEIHTHALYESGEIWVFNEKNGKRYGKFYHYDLSADPASAEKLSQESEDDSVWNEIYAKWKNEAAKYVDTFRTFEEIGLGEQQIHPNESVYSEHSYSYKNETGTDYLAYLTVPSDEKGIPVEKKFILNLYNERSGETTTEEVQLEAHIIAESGGKEGKTEPVVTKPSKFVYTGDDPALKPICDYMIQQGTEYYYFPDGTICIPALVVYDEIERDGSLYVFGNFWVHNYYRNGNTLEDISGGAYPARFELKQSVSGAHSEAPEGAYEIVEVTVAGDGADYDKDIREFTEGFDGVYQKYYGDWEKKEVVYQETRKEFIRMYEEQNHLGIEYYKDYGWEPVAIYE